MDFALVNCVEDFPIIYDKCNKLYKNNVARKNAFASITSILNLQFQISNTQEFYEKRWFQLRKRFTEVRRKMVLTPSGSGAFSYQWPLFGAMEFLNAHTPTRLKLRVGNVLKPAQTCSEENDLKGIERISEDATDEWTGQDDAIIIEENYNGEVQSPSVAFDIGSQQSTLGDSTPVIKKRKLDTEYLSAKNTVCSECRSNLLLFCNFKRACTDQTSPVADSRSDFNTDLEDIVNKHIEPVVEDPITCSFCTKIVGKLCFISLIEYKKILPLVNMLEKRPELNLNNGEQIVSCETCHDSLQGLQSFITNCLDVEEKIPKYAEVEGVDDNGKINLKNVQEFTFNPTLHQDIGCGTAIKEEVIDENQEQFGIKSDPELICENEDDPVPIIKCDEVDIKSEEAEDDDESKGSMKLQIPTYGDHLEKSMYKCKECAFQTLYAMSIRTHMVTHKDPSDMAIFKCELCQLETKYKHNIKRHMLTHDPSINRKYKKVIHKDPSDMTMFKCELCQFETNKKNIKRHMLTHDPSKNHKYKVIHNDPSEITIHKCELCTYETKLKKNLMRHLLTHKDRSERKKYKCKDCPYDTLSWMSMNSHKMTHMDPSDIPIHKCELCTYETNQKRLLKQHVMTHKDPSERKKYKCKDCPYETISDSSLWQHMLIHKDPSKVTVYKCEKCTYESKLKGHFKRHMLTHNAHETLSKMTMVQLVPHKDPLYKCVKCTFTTIYLRRLRQHMSIHKDHSQREKVQM